MRILNVLVLFLVFSLFLLSNNLVFATNGCNIGDAECGTIPTNSCDVRQNTTFVNGNYNLPNGIDVCANYIVLDCKGSTLAGSINDPHISLVYINGSVIKNCNLIDKGIGLLASNFNVITNNSGGITIRGSDYNIIKNNNFDESMETRLDDSDYNILESNIANFHNGYGIFLYRSSFNNLTNNTVSSNRYSGIRIDVGACCNILTSNTVNSNPEWGILIVKSSANVLINNILASNSGGIGMFHHLDPSGITQSFDNKAIGNIVVGSGNGIYTSASRNTIVNNVVYGNSAAGIVVAADGNIVNNNTANFNSQNGFVLDHFSGNFTNNVANSNNQTGIHVVYTQDANISNNIANMNNQTGIYIEGAGPQWNIIADNIANSNGQNGIYTYASGKNNIRNNIVNSNGLYGILVYSYAEDNLTNNTANSNGFAGISLSYTNNNNLVNNTANNNRAYGLLIDKSNDNRVNSNTFCVNSLLSGFYDLAKLEGSGNSGTNNTCDTAFNWTENGNTCTYSCTYPQLVIITQSFPPNTLGIFSSHQLKAGGQPPYIWSLVGGSIPLGMNLHPDGILNGTPTNAGNFTFTIRVNDSNNSMAEKNLTKIVYITLPPVKIKISKWGTTAVPGRIIDYFIALQNIDIIPAQGMSLIEVLDLTLFNLNFSNPQSITLTGIYDGDENLTQAISWNISNLNPGETKMFNYKVKLNSSTPLGTLVVGGPACDVIQVPCDKDPDQPNEPFTSQPLSGMIVRTPNSGYHCLRIPDKTKNPDKKPYHHNGVDLLVPEDIPVYNVEDGFVFAAGLENPTDIYKGFGFRVIILHYNGCYSLYGHLSEINWLIVGFGKPIKAGQEIGRSGQTGNAGCDPINVDPKCKPTPPHLHFEYRCGEDKVPVDPCDGLVVTNPSACRCTCDKLECTEHDQNSTRPRDPNEKTVSKPRYIKNNQELIYTVEFENIGNTSALDVFINDTLSQNLNLSTLQVLNSTSSFVQLTQGSQVILLQQQKNKTITDPSTNISANQTIDETWTATLIGRKIIWTLLGIDLDVNASNEVFFKILPNQNISSGTNITNNATIQFEIFESITTNNTLNTIDETIPSCNVNSLPNTTTDKEFNVSWIGTDTVGEIDSYTVFLSEDNGPYVTLLDNTKDTNTSFIIAPGKRDYKFICITKDIAGNTELQPPNPEAHTYFIGNNKPGLGFIGNKTINEAQTLTIQLEAFDFDNQTLIFDTNAKQILPSQFTFNKTSGLFIWTPTYSDSGIYTITFNVTDSQPLYNVDSQQVTLNITDVRLTSGGSPYIFKKKKATEITPNQEGPVI